jgi:thiamine-monophosphate kinase
VYLALRSPTVTKKSCPGNLRFCEIDSCFLDFKDKKVVVSTDLLIEGVHFDLAYMPLKHLVIKQS